MTDISLKDKLKIASIRKAIRYLEENPKDNLPSLLSLIRSFDKKNKYAGSFMVLDDYLSGTDNGLLLLAQRIFTEVDSDVRKKLLDNFLIFGKVTGSPRRKEAQKKGIQYIPQAIVLGGFTPPGHLADEDIDWYQVVQQGEKLGISIFIFTAENPEKIKVLLRLCENFPNSIFISFIPPEHVTDQFAADLHRVKNAVLVLHSAEVLSHEMCRAAELLKSYELFYGFSTTYEKYCLSILNDESVKAMITQGFFFGVLLPLLSKQPKDRCDGKDSEEICSKDRVEYLRRTKPIFLLDAGRDSMYMEKCLGGQYLAYVSADASVAPCPFLTDKGLNLKNASLAKCLLSLDVFWENPDGSKCKAFLPPEAIVGHDETAGCFFCRLNKG